MTANRLGDGRNEGAGGTPGQPRTLGLPAVEGRLPTGARRRGHRSHQPGTETTPSLMDALATSERRIAERLAETSADGALDSDEARRCLEVLFWADREAEEIHDRRERNQLERVRRRDASRRTSATGWLRVGNRASRFVLGVVVVVLVILTLGALWVSGHLHLSEIIRLLPTG